MSTDTGRTQTPFLVGLFLITCATLLLEILNTRLLSVVTWYHLSFFAVSTAMFGMAAGALWVYLRPGSDELRSVYDQLYAYSLYFAVSVVACHLLVIYTSLDIRDGWTAGAMLRMAAITVAVSTPFFFSGVVVTLALTRVPGNSGLIYAVDLIGAALGSLLCLVLLRAFDISSATFICAAIAVAGMAWFGKLRSGRLSLPLAGLAGLIVIAGLVNSQSINGFRVFYPKGTEIAYDESTIESWTIHGQVLLFPPIEAGPFYWAAGEGAPVIEGMQVQGLVIDGEAGTAVTGWDGDRAQLDWPRFGVTGLPYHLRPGSDVAVIGVGGGRDVLTALWADSSHITALEINGAILEVLQEQRADFVNLANQPEVEFVHDEARSFLTRSERSYDIIQMSLIDTWAATGAGAFTLSENGLYTVEGWQIFLDKLNENGLFSVSRWYSPDALSETNRLLSLATLTLLQRGISEPAEHLALVARERVATLMVSPQPLSESDQDRIDQVAEEYGFTVLHSPRQPSEEALTRSILNSGSEAALREAVAHDYLDLSPPTDSRPYFFNTLKPAALFGGSADLAGLGIVAGGNLLATYTLLLLCGLSLLGVAAVILLPLWLSGRPDVPRGVFGYGLMYFACIGTGFMMVQIPLIQRFSVYLGHPVYAVAVLLFSMILAAGVGSILSDRIAIDRRSHWPLWLPASIAALILFVYLGSGWIIVNTISLSLLLRCLIVIAIVATLALPMGMCFPLGLRLFREYSGRCLPWMWGINGATGVLASVAAVAISMWVGISASLLLALLCYAALMLPALKLRDSLH